MWFTGFPCYVSINFPKEDIPIMFQLCSLNSQLFILYDPIVNSF